jgi:hypothetical protein
VGAAAVALPGTIAPAPAGAEQFGDALVLQFLLRVEQTLAYAYERALASGVLTPTALAVVTACLNQEHEHIDALTVNAVRLGAPVPAAVPDLATFELQLRALHVKRNPTSMHSERGYVNFLTRLENVTASVYHFAIEQLNDDKLLQTAAQIMANEGQHATILSEILAPGNVKRAVPSAYVGGTA